MCSLGWPECRSGLGLACAFCRRVDQRADGFRSFSTEEDLHTCDRLPASARRNGVTPTDSDSQGLRLTILSRAGGLVQEHRLLGLGMALLLITIALWLVHQQCGVCQQVDPILQQLPSWCAAAVNSLTAHLHLLDNVTVSFSVILCHGSSP